MRLVTFTLILAAGLATAGAASAQMGGWEGTQGYEIGHTDPDPFNNSNSPAPSRAYIKKLTALSYKIVEQRAEDGGTLTSQHLTSLQRELNWLNHQYEVGSSLRVRPTA
jgi:hypothetical protein